MDKVSNADIEEDVLKFFTLDKLNLQRSSELIQQVMHLNEADLFALRDLDAKAQAKDQTTDSLRTLLTQLARIANMVAVCFAGDIKKVELWFTLPNYNFGNASPRDMIRFGRYDKLLKFVIDAREAEQPPDNEAL